MKKTRTGGYLRQLLHLIGKFVEDKQNGKRFTITSPVSIFLQIKRIIVIT
jgi:hypothetical protein